MSNFYNVLSEESYKEQRFNTIRLLEGKQWDPYVDTVKVATIGYGFNIQIKDNFSAVAKKIAPSLTSSQIDQIYKNAILGKTYTDDKDENGKIIKSANQKLRDALNSEMSNLHAENSVIPETFAFTNDKDVKDLFEESFIKTYEDAIPSFVDNSTEKAVLFSMVYNAGAGIIGSGLSNALMSENRAEAWYEIRYRSNVKGKDEDARRRYYESEEFGIYKNPTNPTEKEAKDAFKMFTQHKSKIDDYDAKFDKNISVAESSYGLDIKTLDESLSPAKNYLVNKYANGKEIDNILIGDFGDQAISDSLTGGKKNDLIFGENGNDTLNGGQGDDTYIFNDNYGFDTIIDSDNSGSIVVNGVALSGTAKNESSENSNSITSIYKLTSNGKSYNLVLNGSDLVINDVSNSNNIITIKNFKNGSFGITLDKDTDSDKVGLKTPFDVFKGAVQSAVPPKDPLIIDVKGDGLKLSSWESSGVRFDMDGNGTTESTGWTTPSSSNYAYNKGAGAIIIDQANANLIERIAFKKVWQKKEMFFQIFCFVIFLLTIPTSSYSQNQSATVIHGDKVAEYSDYYFKFFLEKKLYDSSNAKANLDLNDKKRNMMVDLGETYISVVGGYALLNTSYISPMVDNFEHYPSHGSSLLADKVYYLRDENGYKVKFQTKSSKIVSFEILEKGSAPYEEKVKSFFSLQKKASECQKSSQFINYANALAGAKDLDKTKLKLLEEIKKNSFFINNENYSFANPIKINKVDHNQTKSENGVRIFRIPGDNKIRIMPVYEGELTKDGEYYVSNVSEDATKFDANFKNGSMIKIKDCIINSIKK